ncbi:hypothetical protein ACVI1T_005062 [Rhizobium redzepovicii]|jgi:hypothetical protein
MTRPARADSCRSDPSIFLIFRPECVLAAVVSACGAADFESEETLVPEQPAADGLKLTVDELSKWS